MIVDALLCDAATVREGLLHVLGGGITRVFRREFPAALGINLALRIVLPRENALDEHEVRIVLRRLNGPEDEGSASATMTFHGNEDRLPPPPAEIVVPAAIPLRDLRLPEPGHYIVEIFGDGTLLRTLQLEATFPLDGPHPNG